MFDVQRVREEFPALNQQVHGHALVYLDSAATALKPRIVTQTTASVYEHDCANVHRGVHVLSARATQRFEAVRVQVMKHIHAEKTQEILFSSGATGSLNLLAFTLTQKHVCQGDVVLVSAMEHHSNIVPWQLACERVGATVLPIPMRDDGTLSIEAYTELLNRKPKIVVFTHISNATGVVNPVALMTSMARDAGALSVVDGTQAVPHQDVNVQALGVDAYVFSAHKAYGPNGAGVAYVREDVLCDLPPYQGGGDMIRRVSFLGTTFADLPNRFEAGTPNIAGVIAMGTALEYMQSLGTEARAHEQSVYTYAKERLRALPDVRILVDVPEQTASLSLMVGDIHPHDVGTFLDREGVAVRVGHHCAQPLMEHLGVPATVRVSLGVYNTRDDIDCLCDALVKTAEFFR